LHEIRIFHASTVAEIDTAFAALASERPDGLVISSGLLFLNRRIQIAHLAMHYASYGTSLTDARC
jgi:hypothetical protein